MPTNRSRNLNRAVAMYAAFKHVVPSYYNLPSLSQHVVTTQWIYCPHLAMQALASRARLAGSEAPNSSMFLLLI